MSTKLSITYEQWQNDLNKANELYKVERIVRTTRNTTKDQLEFIEFARNKKFPWKVVLATFNQTFSKNITLKSIMCKWDKWKNRKDEWGKLQ